MPELTKGERFAFIQLIAMEFSGAMNDMIKAMDNGVYSLDDEVWTQPVEIRPQQILAKLRK